MRRTMKLRTWLKLVFLFPCLMFLGVGGEGGGAEEAGEAERIAAEEAEAARLAAAGEAESEDRGDEFTPAQPAGEEALDPEALAAIAAAEEGEPGGKGTPPKHVPYDRFSEVNLAKKEIEADRNRERAERERLEAELAALKGAAAPEKTGPSGDPLQSARTELRDLRKEYRTALSDVTLDPKDEAAVARLEELEEKIGGVEDRIIELRTLSTIETRTARETAQTTLEAVVNQAHADFPFLDPQSPHASAELNNDIIAYRDGKVAQGVPLAEALRLAVDKFAPAYAKEKGIELPGGKGGATDDVAARKAQAEKEARERAAAASVAQPAAIAHAGRGARSSESQYGDIASLDERTFDSIPEAELRKQRGD